MDWSQQPQCAYRDKETKEQCKKRLAPKMVRKGYRYCGIHRYLDFKRVKRLKRGVAESTEPEEIEVPGRLA